MSDEEKAASEAAEENENPDGSQGGAGKGHQQGVQIHTEGEFDAEKAKAKISKVNSEAANLRKRLKELEPLANKAKELEDESKSESEKLTEANSSLEKRAVSAEREVARLTVALDKGLTKVQAKRLIGETEEELEADADELLASFTKKNDGKADEESQEDKKSESPKGGERSGATGDKEPEETDPRKLAEGLPAYS